jgi:hypothetical protein
MPTLQTGSDMGNLVSRWLRNRSQEGIGQLFRRLPIAVALLVSVHAASSALSDPVSDLWRVGEFEEATWEGVTRSAERVFSGAYSGKWSNLKATPSIKAPGFPADLSQYDRLQFSMHSSKANGQRLTLVLDSENRAAPGWDYYFYHFTVDWEGWKTFDLHLGQGIRPTRRPVGWHQISYFSINASGWQNKPLADTVLYLDAVRFVRGTVGIAARQMASSAGGLNDRLAARWELSVTNRSRDARTIPLVVTMSDAAREALTVTGIPTCTELLGPKESATFGVTLTAGQAVSPLTRFSIGIEAASATPDSPAARATVSLVSPLPSRRHPFLFGDAGLFELARVRAGRLPWAKAHLDGIVAVAERHLAEPLSLPDSAGQWSHHYVCKACGNRLKHVVPKHVCRGCSAEYTGWPYDQVAAGWQHGRNFRQARDMALAYTFTGRGEFASRTREILLAYAQRYPEWKLQNVRGHVSNSAGRLYAQTLDEACAVIGLAWSYDLVYGSGVLQATDRAHIETRLFREMVKTIRRNQAGISNWQSWHNAGVAAVGFCLQDAEMVSHALRGKNGLEFQFRKSILEDGFWYEGTAAYHYYALDALRWTVEAAWFAGIDYWTNAAYKSLYDAPLLYTFPDLNFPAINDSDIFSLKGRHRLYELAYVRTNDVAHLMVAQFGERKSMEAFLYGPDELPEAPAKALESRVFAGIGAAVLRHGQGRDQLYLHLDYGPHGGGHGHQDKLALTFFGLGRQLGPDPGRLAYGAPLQGAWYRQTFAHNTICVDGVSQRSTTGRLTLFHDGPEGAIMQGESTGAYTGVTLRRTVVLVDGLVVDVFVADSEAEHTYDWVYHNVGTLHTDLTMTPRPEPLGTRAGYQHMSDIREGHTDGAWSVDFVQPDGVVKADMAGGTGTAVFAGMGMMNNPPVPCPVVVARRTGKRALFVAVIEPTRTSPRVRGVRALECRLVDEVAVEIDLGEERFGVLLADTAGPRREFLGKRTDGRFLIVRQER